MARRLGRLEEYWIMINGSGGTYSQFLVEALKMFAMMQVVESGKKIIIWDNSMNFFLKMGISQPLLFNFVFSTVT